MQYENASKPTAINVYSKWIYNQSQKAHLFYSQLHILPITRIADFNIGVKSFHSFHDSPIYKKFNNIISKHLFHCYLRSFFHSVFELQLRLSFSSGNLHHVIKIKIHQTLQICFLKDIQRNKERKITMTFNGRNTSSLYPKISHTIFVKILYTPLSKTLYGARSIKVRTTSSTFYPPLMLC